MASNDVSFADRYGSWALIAGASDGVGAAYAHEMAHRGVNVLLLARRQALLRDLAADIRANAQVEAQPVPMDLAQQDAFTRILEATDGLEVGMVMYNAGADPYYEHFLTYPVEPALAMIHRNCVVPTQLCHHFGGLMQTRGRGGIVLVSSAGGLMGRVNMVTYGGTKAFDTVFAEALWAELLGSGVDVLAPILGATDTPALRRLLSKRGMLSEADDATSLPATVSGDLPTWPRLGCAADRGCFPDRCIPICRPVATVQ